MTKRLDLQVELNTAPLLGTLALIDVAAPPVSKPAWMMTTCARKGLLAGAHKYLATQP